MNKAKEHFPDGTPIEEWFYDTKIPELKDLGKQYILTEYGICDDGRIYTKEIQKLIDTAHVNGGGVIVVPSGTYMTGALFFKQGVHLYLSENAVLKGSDDVSDYKLQKTRIEGETCVYFSALINVDGVDGFTLYGPGTIDGNGHKSWRAFWLRTEWNPSCTNKDEQRPRLVYISNSKNVLIADVRLENSHFWTTHIYKCTRVKYLNCHIYSPGKPIYAPSTDAIDIDVCEDVMIKKCHFEVNDDSVALKGGKGIFADKAIENGSNERIIIEDCVCRGCHGCLTCGSESVHNRNIIVRRLQVDDTFNLLWLKMRPDTPQHYEYITVEDVEGKIDNFIHINPWTQFFNLQGFDEIPISIANHISMRNCKCECDTFFRVTREERQYHLSDFTFENLRIKAKNKDFDEDVIERISVSNVSVE